jgi:surface polysaccharide O-acyltransferase-like enzyme
MNLIDQHSKRESGTELLRIVAMLMIVSHHIFRHIVMSDDGLSAVSGNMDACLIAKLLDAFVLIGVNVFIMISGYYKIKLSVRKLLSLFLLLSMFKIVRLLLVFKAGNVEIINYFEPLIPFTHCGWYMEDYFVLCLLAPILNAFIDYSSKYNYKKQIAIYAFMMIYLGFFWGIEGFSDGYSVNQFVFLYLVGAFIHKFSMSSACKSSTLIITYVTCSVLTGVLMCLTVLEPEFRHFNFSAYDSPLMIVSSIAFFLLMMKINFKNKWVNFVAAATLSVWLIQEGAGWGSSYCYHFMQNLYISHSVIVFIGIIILYIVFLFAAAIFFDNLFKYIVSLIINPIMIPVHKIKDRIFRKDISKTI